MTLGKDRKGFTLIEVLIASFILVLFPAGALLTAMRLEKFAREQVEMMAASAVCEDIYNRCLREEMFGAKTNFWKDLNKSLKVNAWRELTELVKTDRGVYWPIVKVKGETNDTNPLKRDGYATVQYRIVRKDEHDVRVSLRWGPNREYYYHR